MSAVKSSSSGREEDRFDESVSGTMWQCMEDLVMASRRGIASQRRFWLLLHIDAIKLQLGGYELDEATR